MAENPGTPVKTVKPPAQKTVPAAPGHKQAHEVLRGYIAYRRAQLEKIAGPPGINRGGAGPILAAARGHILDELNELAAWLEAGQPSPQAVLTEDDRSYWRATRDRGLPVPKEILDQL